LPVEVAIENLRRTLSADRRMADDAGNLLDLLAQVAGVPARTTQVRAEGWRPSTTEEAWDELYSKLYDPGGAMAATCCAALPVLAALACTDAAPVEAMIIAGGIVDTFSREELAAYSADNAVLRDAAERTLTTRLTTHHALCTIQALAAFEGLEPWGWALTFLASEDGMTTCPSCGADLWATIPPDGSVSLSPDTEITPADLSTLDPADARVYQLVNQYGGRERRRLVAPLLNLFSTVVCPGCATSYRISDALRAARSQ